MVISDIQFVIVLYKQDLAESRSFIALKASLDKLHEKGSLFIYDNSPQIQEVASVTQDTFQESIYVHDPTNSGLSVAYNTASRHAKKKDRKWLFLLDQDTHFPDDTLLKYMQAIELHPEFQLFAPILEIADGLFMSPCRYKYKWGKLMKSVEPGVYSFSDTAPVNSGICVNLDAFFAVGGYNENIRLDGADYQFIERFKKKHENYLVLDIRFHQDFSLFDRDETSLINRFSLFLKDVSNFERDNFLDEVLYARLAFVRMLKLTLQTRSRKFLALYLNSYLPKKSTHLTR
jgi:GT2 family glycosyltransferase